VTARNSPYRKIWKTGSLELRVWLRLLGCTNIILRNLRSNLKERFSVTLPRFDLLAQVARPRLGPSLSELSRRLLVTKGNITDIVSRLEAEKLIERRRDAADGRIQYVFLTDSGRDLLNEMLPAHDLWLKEIMRGLSREEMSTLYQALGILTSSLKRFEGRKADVGDARNKKEDTQDDDLDTASKRTAAHTVRE
jgi:DNA-binding MarR family transcriptional regulator